MDQHQGPMLAPRQILDEPHDVAVFFGRLDDEGRDFGFAQRNKRLEAALSAYEVIARSTRALANCDRLLQPEMRDAVDQFLKDALVARSRVQDRNQVHRDRTDFRLVFAHAATRRGTRFVSSTKASSVSKR